VVSRVLKLFGGWGSGQSDFEDGEESLFMDGQQALFFWFPDINNFAFSDVDDLVKALYLAPNDLSDPQSLVHETLGGLDGDELFAFPKEKSEGT
jgi:hypothetical protein